MKKYYKRVYKIKTGKRTRISFYDDNIFVYRVKTPCLDVTLPVSWGLIEGIEIFMTTRIFPKIDMILKNE
jgi:hypothetical protein